MGRWTMGQMRGETSFIHTWYSLTPVSHLPILKIILRPALSLPLVLRAQHAPLHLIHLYQLQQFTTQHNNHTDVSPTPIPPGVSTF
jgi:hypothetical protein